MYKLSYYLQTNLFCVLILLLILIGLRNKTRYSVLLFKKILFCSILFCMFDIVSVIFRGTNYNSSNLILTFSNSFYLFLPLLLQVLSIRVSIIMILIMCLRCLSYLFF